MEYSVNSLLDGGLIKRRRTSQSIEWVSCPENFLKLEFLIVKETENKNQLFGILCWNCNYSTYAGMLSHFIYRFQSRVLESSAQSSYKLSHQI